MKKCVSFSACALIVLTGCMGPGAGGLPAARPLGSDMQSFHAEMPNQKSDALPEPVEDSGTMSLQRALALALMKNPALAAYSWDVRAAEAKSIQACAGPNPELEVEVTDFGGSGEDNGLDSATTSIVLSQIIEIGGRRSSRKRAANLELQLAGWDYEASRLDVLTETTERFVDALAAQEALELAHAQLNVASNVHAAVTGRVDAGKDSPLELIKSKSELASSKLAVMRSERDFAESRRGLASMWGSPRAAFSDVDGLWPVIPESIPGLDEIEKRLAESLEMQRLSVETDLADAALAAAKAERIPELGLSAGIERSGAEDEQTFIAGVSVQVPIFDRNRGGIGAARADVEKAKLSRQTVEAALRSELESAYEELTYSRQSALSLDKDILPAAQEAFDAAQTAYGAGKCSYLDVLDAQRTLFEAKSIHLEVKVSYHRAQAKLERLSCQPLNTIEKKKEI